MATLGVATPTRHALNAVGVRFAVAAGSVDTTLGTLGQSRHAAARPFGAPQLQANYDGEVQGRNPEQERWQTHHAHLTARVSAALDHDDLITGGDVPPGPGRAGPLAGVPVTATARGADRWTAPTAPYRLGYLLTADPVRGGLVDDGTTTPHPTPAPAPAR